MPTRSIFKTRNTAHDEDASGGENGLRGSSYSEEVGENAEHACFIMQQSFEFGVWSTTSSIYCTNSSLTETCRPLRCILGQVTQPLLSLTV